MSFKNTALANNQAAEQQNDKVDSQKNDRTTDARQRKAAWTLSLKQPEKIPAELEHPEKHPNLSQNSRLLKIFLPTRHGSHSRNKKVQILKDVEEIQPAVWVPVEEVFI